MIRIGITRFSTKGNTYLGAVGFEYQTDDLQLEIVNETAGCGRTKVLMYIEIYKTQLRVVGGKSTV